MKYQNSGPSGTLSLFVGSSLVNDCSTERKKRWDCPLQEYVTEGIFFKLELLNNKSMYHDSQLLSIVFETSI